MFFLILLIFPLSFANELKVSKDRWYCKTESAFLLTHRDFHSQQAVFNYNECCAINEDCYNSLISKYCDYYFEWCIHRVISQYQQSYELISKIEPYSKDGKSDFTREYETYNVNENQLIAEIYPTLYIKCKAQNATFSSCAFEFDNCILSDDQYNCYLKLDQCLDRTFVYRLYDAICNQAVRAVQIVVNQFIETTGTKCESLI
ncbi:unnamed protein product [Caenorhabditis angaria]|uniref:Uncharacterized protein n=1 Tax=Caenorhabditis angaria TaxID=860376 RepID=A0A9P1N563_9PELO|nr:unnamed protein product [Caenorhabditis angaria]